MPMTLGLGEPPAGPWRVAPLSVLVDLLVGLSAAPADRPRIVAVDGRGGGGKTTLAERLKSAVPGATVVHTDDIAWWHSRFGWADLMIEGVLEPLHRGDSVRYQPPAWAPRGRTGHVEVSSDASLVLIEGVGASRREVASLLDGAIWLQSDFAEAERRGILRDSDRPDIVREWHEWMEEEIPFLAADCPWERADVIVHGSPDLPHDALTEVVLAERLGTVRTHRDAR